MNKEYFLRELKYLLGDLSEEEQEEALQYYADYLEEAGPEHEQEVLAQLGSPEKVAAEIRSGLSGASEAGEFTERGYRDERFETKGQMPDKYTEIVAGEVVDRVEPGTPGERLRRAGRKLYEYGRSRMEYETGSYREVKEESRKKRHQTDEAYEPGSHRGEKAEGQGQGRREDGAYETGSCRRTQQEDREQGSREDGAYETGSYRRTQQEGREQGSREDGAYESGSYRRMQQGGREQGRREDGAYRHESESGTEKGERFEGRRSDTSEERTSYGHYRRADGGTAASGAWRESAESDEERRELQRRRRKGGLVALILFLVFGLPLGGSIIGAGFSILAAVIGGVFGIFGGLISLIVGGFAAVAGLLAGGVGMIIGGFMNMATPALGTAAVGGGFFLLALAMLLLIVLKWGCTTVVPGFFRFCMDLVRAGFRLLGRVARRIFGGGDRE